MYDLILRSEQHRQDLMAQAEQRRLVQQVRAARPASSMPFYRPVLAAVGHRLIAWGKQLQNQQANPENRRPVTAP